MAELVVAQDAREESVERRGLVVGTISGTIVALLFALIVLIGRSQRFTLPHAARAPLYAALVLFSAACTLGLVSNAPWTYAEEEDDRLRSVIEWKANLVFLAVLFEVIGVVTTAIAAAEVVAHI